MSLSSAELWHRISAQQLASPMQCRSWAAEAAAGLLASEAIDGTRMASQLVALGKLSPFQADVLTSGSDEPLTRHGWRIIEPVNFAPLHSTEVRAVWNDWWLATKTPNTPPAWIRWLTAADLEQDNIRDANPSLPLALQHSQVAGANLQGVAAPEMVGGALQLSVSPLNGKLLSAFIAERPMSVESVVAMWLQAAAALSSLHTAGLAHGRVTPDRLGIDEEGNWQLLRDPLCGATLGISRPSLGILASRLPGKLMSAHFMAPEFLLPAQAATPQTDCYALGCVAWLALVGQPPVSGKHAEQILAAHADQKLDLKRLAHVPEPLTRCLLHCLAKNPAARFASARDLRESLIEAQRLIDAGRAARPSPSAQPQPSTPTAPRAAEPAKRSETTKPTVAAIQPDAPAKPVEPVTPTAPAKPPASVKPVEPAKLTEPAQPPAASQSATSAKSVGSEKPADPAAPARPFKVAAVPASTSAPSTEPAKASAQLKPAAQPIAAPGRKPAQAPAAASAPTPSASAVRATVAPTAVVPTTVVPAAVAPAELDASVPPPSQAQQPSTVPLAASSPDSATAPSAAPGVRTLGKGKPVVRSSVRRASSKRKKNNAWLVPAIGAGALVALLLLVLVLNGGLGSPSSPSVEKKPVVATSQTGTGGTGSAAAEAEVAGAADPRLAHFELVDSSVPVLWAPPREPEPLPLDLLPPGGQIFLSLRPAALFAQPDSKELLGLLDPDLGTLWEWLGNEAGVPVEAIDQVTIAAYAGQSGTPQFALRVQLQSAQSLQQLKAAWDNPTDTKVGEHVLLVSGNRGYYVAAQPLVDSQSVSTFSVGPVELASEAVEMQGAVGPMTSQLEQLWQWSDGSAEVSLLLTPSFLFTGGRQLVERAPERLAEQLVQWLSRDMRGMMLNTSLKDEWFYEVRLAGGSDRDAGAIHQRLSDAVQKLPQEVESWFVSQSPHPYWRAIALRYPNMLRALAAQTRFGVENGQAVANGYLPVEAAPNLLYASWIALQPSATMAVGSQASAVATAPSQPPLTPEQILDRPITVVIDQEGIEVVLRLIGEQANEKLPPGTRPLRFELDGPAFQRAGFTRNQQVKDFKIESQPVRALLTELAKRGNPVTGVTDLRSDEQKMIWVLTEAADKPGEPMVSLTSREAAKASKTALPVEFAPAAQ